MEQIDMKCPSCGYKLKGPGDLKNKPIELLELCPSCPKWNKGLFLLAVFVTILIFTFLIVVMAKAFQIKIVIGVFGLILDVWGGFLIATGYTEKIFAEAASMGDEEDDLLFPHLPKQTKRIRYGLILLILGFLFQALSGILSGISNQ